MNCVDFYSKVTVSRQVQIRKQWLKEDGIIDNNLECRQECRKNKNKTKKTQKWPKGRETN